MSGYQNYQYEEEININRDMDIGELEVNINKLVRLGRLDEAFLLIQRSIQFYDVTAELKQQLPSYIKNIRK